MKKLTIIVADEDLVKIVGSCLKINADFTVEAIPDEAPKPPRHITRLPNGTTATTLLIGYLKAKPTKMAFKREITTLLEEIGLVGSGSSACISKARSADLVEVSGDVISLKE